MRKRIWFALGVPGDSVCAARRESPGSGKCWRSCVRARSRFAVGHAPAHREHCAAMQWEVMHESGEWHGPSLWCAVCITKRTGNAPASLARMKCEGLPRSPLVNSAICARPSSAQLARFEGRVLYSRPWHVPPVAIRTFPQPSPSLRKAIGRVRVHPPKRACSKRPHIPRPGGRHFLSLKRYPSTAGQRPSAVASEASRASARSRMECLSCVPRISVSGTSPSWTSSG